MGVVSVTREFEFYAIADLSKHAGEWVAIVDHAVIATGKDLKQVLAEAGRKSRDKEPLIARVPLEDETLIL